MPLLENERSCPTGYFYRQDDECLNFQIHLHYSFEVIYALAGAITCTTEDKNYRLTAKHGLLILPGQVHSYSTAVYSRTSLFVFSADFIPDFAQNAKGCRLTDPVFTFTDESEPAVLGDPAANRYSRQAVLYAVCGRVMNGGGLVRTDSAGPSLTETVAAYIQDNFTGNITLRRLADELGYNYSYMSAYFNKNFSTDFPTYVNTFRLQYAARRLLDSGDGITGIALESGFSTIRNFNRSFRLKYGVSPREYRDGKSGEGSPQ